MKRSIIIGILFFGLFTSCSKKTTTVAPVSDISTLSPKGMVYILPKTTLQVRVVALQSSYTAGPYAQFAQKYLGLSNIASTSRNTWEIQEISVSPSVEPDMEAIFAVEPVAGFNVDFLKLSSAGLVIPIGSANFYSPEQSMLGRTVAHSEAEFTDLSPTPFIAAEKTTHYSRVFQDSTFVRVPVHRTVVVERSLEDKAREAAEFIFSLRKRRFELLSGDADFVAEGKAAEAVLAEISRLESEYLTLFIGKEIKTTKIHLFDYGPSRQSNGPTILFRFSGTRGVLSSSDLSGSPMLISVTPEANWMGVELLEQLSSEKGIQRTDAVYYRIPVPSVVKISDSQNDFFSQRISFHQFGPLVRMPAKFITDDFGKILFPATK